MQFIQDHWEDNDAEEAAGRLDVEYDLGSGGWLSSLKAGVRFADRDQKVRYSTYNWAPIAPSWSCNGAAFNVDTTTPTPYPVDGAGTARGLSDRHFPGLSRRHLGIDESQQPLQRRRLPEWSAGLSEPRHTARLRSAHAKDWPIATSTLRRVGIRCAIAPPTSTVASRSRRSSTSARRARPRI